MNLLTIASRSNLGSVISASLDGARSQLDEAINFLNLVESSLDLSGEQQSYVLSSSLMGALGFFEAALSDVAKKYLVAYPGRLAEKTTSLEELSRTGSIVGIVEEKAEQHINKLAYKMFTEYSEAIVALFTQKESILEDTVNVVTEIKATRDVYAHGGGYVNSTYLKKVERKARSTSVGQKLPLTYDYVRDSIDQLKTYIDEFKTLIPEKVLSHGRTATLREMWESTIMGERMPFEEAWTVEDENMVRPQDKNQESFSWSHSEVMLLDFFLGVYRPDYHRRENNLETTLARWLSQSNEHKIMRSWVETPFRF